MQAELGVANDSLGTSRAPRRCVPVGPSAYGHIHIAGDLSSCFNAGLCVGAFIWGVLIDVIGRKWAFNISLFVTSFFGLLVGLLFQPVYVHFD